LFDSIEKKDDGSREFNSGHAVVLSRGALNLLGPHIGQKDEKGCWVHVHQHADDVFLADCFRRLGVKPHDTRLEEDGEKRELFNVFHPDHYKGGYPDWYLKYRCACFFSSSSCFKHSYNHGDAYSCCSKRAITFHFVGHKDLPKKLRWKNGRWNFVHDEN
jgi:hypothetical protein